MGRSPVECRGKAALPLIERAQAPLKVDAVLGFCDPVDRLTKECREAVCLGDQIATGCAVSLAPFARDLGYDGPPFAWDEDRRAHLRADLDAFYARAYGLTRDELRYILDPADVKGPDYPSETFRVLKEKEIRHHGEYRTRRLVLAAWDRMEANGEFTAMGM